MAKYEVTVNNPVLGKGVEVEIPGLGIVKNGSTTEVSEEQAETFRLVNQGPVVTEQDENGADVYKQPDKGPTLLQAYKDDPHVEVRTVEEKPKQDKPTPPKGGDQ